MIETSLVLSSILLLSVILFLRLKTIKYYFNNLFCNNLAYEDGIINKYCQKKIYFYIISIIISLLMSSFFIMFLYTINIYHIFILIFCSIGLYLSLNNTNISTLDNQIKDDAKFIVKDIMKIVIFVFILSILNYILSFLFYNIAPSMNTIIDYSERINSDFHLFQQITRFYDILNNLPILLRSIDDSILIELPIILFSFTVLPFTVIYMSLFVIVNKIKGVPKK